MLVTRLPIALGLSFFAAILLYSYRTTVSHFASPWTACVALAFGGALLLILTYAAGRLRRSVFVSAALAIGLVLRLWWIFWNPSAPNSDFLFMYKAAGRAATGDYSFATSPYYTSFPYQLGFTLYESFVIRLFGNGLLALKLANVLFGLGAGVLLYLSASRVFRETAGRVALLLYVLNVPLIMMSSVLTNQYASSFFFLLGLWLLLDGRRTMLRASLAGLAFSIGHLLRPLGEAYLAAAAVFLLAMLAIRLREVRSLAPVREAAGRLAGVILVFFLVQAAVSGLLVAAHVTPHSLTSGDKYWKFMVGLNANTDGQWSAEDARYANAHPFGEERSRAELAMIRQRLADPGELASLFGRKLLYLWGKEDSAPYWSLQGVQAYRLEKLLIQAERIQALLLCAAGLASLVFLWKAPDRGHSLFLWLLLAYAAAHLLIENQTRYRLDLVPVLLLLQSNGVERLYALGRDRRLRAPVRTDRAGSREVSG